MSLSPKLSAPELFENEFLVLRCKVIEIAAMLDRLENADGSIQNDDRMTQVKKAIQVLLDKDSDRAEEIQLIFSDYYDENWLTDFEPTR